MKTKSEQAYETQMLFKMENLNGVVNLFVEKDRSSVLYGKNIQWPTFENTIGLVMKHLNGTYEKISNDKTDAEKAIEIESNCKKITMRLMKKMEDCKTKEDLEKIKPELTNAKCELTNEFINDLSRCYSEKLSSLESNKNSILGKIS